MHNLPWCQESQKRKEIKEKRPDKGELQKWTKSKSNQIAIFTTQKEFKQGTLSLSQYINEATRLVHACNYGT